DAARDGGERRNLFTMVDLDESADLYRGAESRRGAARPIENDAVARHPETAREPELVLADDLCSDAARVQPRKDGGYGVRLVRVVDLEPRGRSRGDPLERRSVGVQPRRVGDEEGRTVARRHVRQA